MRRYLAVMVVSCVAGSLFLSSSAHADSDLQVVPLQYDAVLTGSDVRSGYIDVANPDDTAVEVTTHVEGFRQADLNGDLQFYPSAVFSAAIIPGLSDFQLGPRERVRVTFSIDPTKLPQGAIDAAVFFQTAPIVIATETKDGSYISESANVGTLLILQHGPTGVQLVHIDHLTASRFAFGHSLRVTATLTNNSASAIYAPLDERVGFGGNRPVRGPLILPAASRNTVLSRSGSYLGLIPVTVTSRDGGSRATTWILACTGYYQWLLAVLLLAGVIYAALRFAIRLRVISWVRQKFHW